MTKTKKTKPELIELLMTELAKHQECKHVFCDDIIPDARLGWRPALISNTAELTSGKSGKCDEIVRALRAQYDLAT